MNKRSALANGLPDLSRRSRAQWIAASLLIALWIIGWRVSAPAPRPVILPSRVESTGAAYPAAPSVQDLLQSDCSPGLTGVQRSRIRSLAAAENRAAAPILRRLQEDRNGFEAFAKRSASSGVTVQAIQDAGRGVSADSKALSRLRRTWWKQALLILTPAQRRSIGAVPMGRGRPIHKGRRHS